MNIQKEMDLKWEIARDLLKNLLADYQPEDEKERELLERVLKS
jgi:hypothetical protein